MLSQCNCYTLGTYQILSPVLFQQSLYFLLLIHRIFYLLVIIIIILNLVEEAKLNNYSIHLVQNLQGARVSCDAVHWGIIFTLTPLVLMLQMFITTLHTLSQQPLYYQPGYFASRDVLLVCMATEHNCFVNPYCSSVLSDNLYPIHSI